MTDTLEPADIIGLCSDLIRIPSVNGHDPERAVAARAAGFARRHGLRVELPAVVPERPNLLVRAGQDRAPGLLLVAHLDTVAVGDEASWSHAPFGAELDGGRIYGRGACDTKGGLAAALGAMALCERRGIPALLIGVPDEEAGATGTLGVKHLHSLGLLAGKGAVYVYPGSREIVVGHRGVCRLGLRANGSAFHSGSLQWQEESTGHNAVAGMAEILVEIGRLRFDETMPGTLFAPYRTVITPTIVAGGSGPSMVPSICDAKIDIRLIPAVGREVVEAAIREIAEGVARRRPPLRVDVAVETIIPPTEIAPDEPVVRAARAAARALLGFDPPLTVSGPANESYLLNGFGIPTCIIGPEGGNAHAADEYVVVDSLVRAAEVYARIAADLA